MVQIVPTILDKTPEEFKAHIEQLKNSHAFQEGWVHIDFADNDFVPNKTLGVEDLGKFEASLKKEAHLMVSHPLEWVDKLKQAGFERIVFHFESKDEVSKVIEAIKKAGMEVGIAINPDTPVDKLESLKDKQSLPLLRKGKIDQVLIMGIIPGFQGQPFIPATIDKVKDLKSREWPLVIATDGAVRDTNAKALVDAGADQLDIGSFLLKGDIDENVEKIWEAISGS